MYIDFENDPNKNNRFKETMFLICIAILMLMTAVTCEGQIACYKRNKITESITRIYSCQGVSYESNGKEITVGIFADSLNEHKLAINLAVFLSISPINPKLIITYEDDEMQEFEPFYNDSNYVQFLAKEYQFMKLLDKKISLIMFVNNDIIYSFREEKIDLFYNFIRGL